MKLLQYPSGSFYWNAAKHGQFLANLLNLIFPEKLEDLARYIFAQQGHQGCSLPRAAQFGFARHLFSFLSEPRAKYLRAAFRIALNEFRNLLLQRLGFTRV